MIFKSASVIAVIAVLGASSALAAPIGYARREESKHVAINRDVHSTPKHVAINRATVPGLSEDLMRRIDQLANQQDESSTEGNTNAARDHTPPVIPRTRHRKVKGPSRRGRRGMGKALLPPPPRPGSPGPGNDQSPGGDDKDPSKSSSSKLNPNQPLASSCPCASSLTTPGDDPASQAGGTPEGSGGDGKGNEGGDGGDGALDGNPGGNPDSPEGSPGQDPPLNGPSDIDANGSAPNPNPSKTNFPGDCEDSHSKLPGGPDGRTQSGMNGTPIQIPKPNGPSHRGKQLDGPQKPGGKAMKPLGPGGPGGPMKNDPGKDPMIHNQRDESEIRDFQSPSDWKRIPPKFLRRHVPASVLEAYFS